MHGYHAVHVIVFPVGVPVEIQVRTQWQHEWAELFEKLADSVGRGVRYGEPPNYWLTRAASDARRRLSEGQRSELHELLVQLVDTTIELGDIIAELENKTDESPEAKVLWARTQSVLVGLREIFEILPAPAEATRRP